jgi:hypothetical protein
MNPEFMPFFADKKVNQGGYENASVLTCRWSIAMNRPVQVAITRKVKPGCEAEFEDAIDWIAGLTFIRHLLG